MPKTPLISDLVDQRDAIRSWLRQEAPQTVSEQAHLDGGSGEQAYWNHGYQAALDDVIELITSRGAHTSGRSSH